MTHVPCEQTHRVESSPSLQADGQTCLGTFCECVAFCFASSPCLSAGMPEQQGQGDDGLASSNDDSRMRTVLTLLEVSARTSSAKELLNASVPVKLC